jgi:hypothetical protein
MLHWISMFAAGAMVVLSIFFVFDRIPSVGYSRLVRRWLPDRPETSAIPAEYSCEKP